jgi:hypothetical protein
MPVLSIDYATVVACLLCVTFFVRGARLDERSPFLWGALSLGAWVCAWLLSGGLPAGLGSQIALFVGLTLWNTRRETARQRARESAR